MQITFQSIGTIHSPFQEVAGMPIQPAGARGVQGSITIEPEFQAGLKDIEGMSHLILLYHLHQEAGYALEVKPFLDNQSHGIFATRAPHRPNAIGLSVVRLQKVEGNTLWIEDVDILDGTPLLDLKPYVPQFDTPVGDVQIGWFTHNVQRVDRTRSDQRFRNK
ncbi:tRNA (N6-threonylcarbamoyladenosine(37)-N6)-methyltransferase TrmO [Rubeoparvulum massiliense]|uniref:tRNA (N6-threonylcarbamoyladenosine(37)-N6)-methyltransferase TrmO n=1 Tax=Rubeoparvulum massiliense TaxID=1631346 RepID=UPI00065E5DC0|nr:tRNA (N6-threonylcarbamoyladenosine(37)-N6)-methyltransferase TrmO [Rubeoparvulum massiliense]